MYPFIELTSEFGFPTYYLVISLVWCLIIFIGLWQSRQYQIHPVEYLDVLLVVMLSGFVGARLFHVLYENPEYYFLHPLDVFYFWQGGFVFYGGALLGGFCGSFWIWRKKLDLPLWLDFSAPLVALGYGLGRLSCFFAGCCYGRYSDLPWALTFHGAAPSPYLPRHPTQLYAVVWELLLFLFLLFLLKISPFFSKNKSFESSTSKVCLLFPLEKGQLFSIWLFFHGWGRIVMENFRADERGPVLFSFSVSTWISLIIIILSVFIFIRQARR